MCSPIELFRVYLGELSKAITVPDLVAMELYAKNIISKEKRDEIQLPNQTLTAKNIILLKAVEAAIRTHEVLEEFLTVLDNYPPSDSVATEIRSKLSESLLILRHF